MSNKSITARLQRLLAADNASLETSFARHRAAGGTLRNAFILKSICGAVRAYQDSTRSFRHDPIGQTSAREGK